MNRIFISYRRADSAAYAALIAKSLNAHYGANCVFYDVTSIAPGVDFTEARARTLEASDVVLVIIGPQWLSTRDPEGRRRLDAPDDFVRLEIADALRAGKLVIPLLVGGAYMPQPEELPDDLKPLALINALELSDEFWDDGVQQLIRVLEGRLGTGASPPPPMTEGKSSPRRNSLRSFFDSLRWLLSPDSSPTLPSGEGAAATRAEPLPATAAAPRYAETTARNEVPSSTASPRRAGSHDIFVSHANEDHSLVEKVVAALEKGEGLRCWVSYRDIPPGAPSWAGTIVDAIARSRLVVVVVSRNSIASDQVLRELTIAADEKIPFIAFCIDDAQLSKDFRYYFSTSQRLQAGKLTHSEALARLTASVRNLVSGTA